ncbi:hypothetical protein SLE2022_269140 [Rubroshorea leprosula]
MMLSKVETGKKNGGDSGSGKLLTEIEAISKALYLDRNPSRSLSSTSTSRSKSALKSSLPEPKSKVKNGNEDPSQKGKKSFWNWKPLKALSHVRNRRFNCCFSLQVNNIDGLPPSFNNTSFCVHWKRRDGDLVTRLAKVFDGMAEFEEKLTYTCSVYGSRSGPHHSAKYEAKHFLLYASVFEAPELDLGKHRVDLTRLLPITLEELDEEKSSGEWMTSFKLSGQAKGATMNVSFGYSIVGDNPIPPRDNQNVAKVLHIKQNNLSYEKPVTRVVGGDGKGRMRRVESLPNVVKGQTHFASHSIDDIKDLHEVLPMSRSGLAGSVNMLYRKFIEEKLDAPVDYKPEQDVFTEKVEPIKPQPHPMSDESDKENIENDVHDNEFSAVEQGIELSSEELAKSEDVIIMASDAPKVESPQVVKVDFGAGANSEENNQLPTNHESGSHEAVVQSQEDDQCSKELILKELELALNNASNLGTGLDSPEDQDDMEFPHSMGRSNSLDDITESVANEFLAMLDIEHSPFGLSSESEPESPRERLLRQFEKDALASGSSLFDFDLTDNEQPECSYDNPTVSDWGNLAEDFDLSSFIAAAEEEHQMPTHARSKTNAKILEDLEAEALMSEWGLNEKAFQGSSPHNSGGFGSPIDLPPEDPFELPSLGEGLGSFIQTKDGGFLRSMNPSIFKNNKSGGSLIMQASNPVVVPAEMGSGVMEILQQLASLGIEKLSMQANKLMPLEDITGKTMQQVAWEAAPTLEGPQRHCLLHHESDLGQDITGGQKEVRSKSSGSRTNKFNSTSANEMASEFVSLEDLAPLAMDKIEALSMEGLRIQSGMSDEDAPSNINAQSIGEISALQGKGVGISGSLGLEGAAGLQLLDIKDSVGDDDGLMGLSLTLDEWMRLDSGEIDDEDQISEQTSKILAAHHASSLHTIRGGSKGEKKRGRKCGLLGNNFTVALMVQLRDPLRNHEPVGAPMLALIQVERVFVPPKPRIYCKVSELRSNSEDNDMPETAVKEDEKEEMKEEKASQEEGIPQFRITEVHLAGLKPEPGKKKLWGSKNQQQSGSRWLLANGMGKSNKHPLMKSKAAPKSSDSLTTKVQPDDTLWSISSRAHGAGPKWKDLAALNPHIRNPNVVFPNENIRLQ